MKKIVFLPLLLAFTTVPAISNEIDKELSALAQNDAVVTTGKALFMQACAACHGKDLSGATGFNLKDGEWIHGEAPSQILSSVTQGFNNAGMPAFGSIFSDKQLIEVVAFIMSERQGMADLTYKIYQMLDVKDRLVSEGKLIKSGKLAKNLMDFELPEIKHYTLEFEGTLYVPKEPSKLVIEAWKLGPTKLVIDGKELPKDNPNTHIWTLKPGKQHIKFQYIVSEDTKHNWKKNLALFVTSEDLGIKLFGISTRSQKIMLDKKVNVIASDKIVVQRKKIHNLPTYSISVGFPEKINYAFNTRSCDVVGLWQGDLLNVGPNVESRGKDGSIVLGDWLLNKNDVFTMQSDSKCRYQKMVNQEVPAFFFERDGIDYKLTTSGMSINGLSLNYEVISKQTKSVTFNLPENGKVIFTSQDGAIENNILTIKPNTTSFSINVSAK